MRIAIVTSAFPPYRAGISHAAFYESRELARIGHDVTVITPRYRRLPSSDNPPSEPRVSIRRLPPLWESGNAAICSGLKAALESTEAILLHYP